ncbi:putative WD repeat-containing protein 43-like, partial [Capsicum annuum]
MDDAIKTKGEAELADMLQKSLKRKRYLIVLDDIWSCEVWDGMRRCFPTEDSAGSRILLTTRNNEVARNAGIENLSMQMNFMDQDESWNHFKSAAFSNEVLSSEFETIGKKIAQKCHGLPLTIVVVAGLLKSKGAIEDWESVAKDVTSFITNDPDEQCSHVLGEIPVKNLMRSWMDEGFLKLGNDLEGEAEKCLQELVDRCLVLFCKKSLDGTKIRSCKNVNISVCKKMQPFKRVTGDEIDYCPYGLYRELLTPVHRQLRDHDNNDLLKRTHSIFSFHLKDSYFSGLQS